MEDLGAQNAILGGGRYDGLMKHLGGPDRAGIGFAAGLERLVSALPEGAAVPRPPEVFLVAVGEDARVAMLGIVRELRQAGIATLMDYGTRSLKAQMKRADRSGAPRVLILGSDELEKGEITLRDMRTSEQRAISRDALGEHLARG